MSSAITALIDAFRRLPGVGPRSAQRLALHLMHHDQQGALALSAALTQALTQVRRCERCQTFTESALCDICADPRRDATLLCVVESPADLAVIEQSHTYRGLYFVLMGRLNPIEGVGPLEIQFETLLARACDGVVREVVIATSFNTEGETTAHYLIALFKGRGLQATRLARGVPIGSEIEYVDPGTIAYAMLDRR